MPSFNDFSTTDAYQDASEAGAPTIQNVLPLPNGGGRFNVGSNGGAVLCELQYGGLGAVEWAENEEQLLNPGAYGTIPDGACGIRFRSAVPGTPGIVSASMGTDPTRPALSIDALGTVVAGAANVISQQIFDAAGAYAYTLPANVRAILVEVIGGGGAGGGAAATGASTASVGAGGGGGGYAAKLITAPAADYAVTVGAGGVAVAGGIGGNGGASSFGAGPDAQATGGAGGGAGAAVTQGTTFEGTAAGIGTIGDVLLQGQYGSPGFVITSTIITNLAGAGGMAARGGTGGYVRGPSGGGIIGQAGGGGSGAVNGINQAARAGGNGADGLVIVTEFY